VTSMLTVNCEDCEYEDHDDAKDHEEQHEMHLKAKEEQEEDSGKVHTYLTLPYVFKVGKEVLHR
jgi:glutaredoxin